MPNVDCLFCGEHRKRAKEHVWPAWLQRHFASLKHEFHGTHFTFPGVPKSIRTQSGASLLLGGVCEPCNTGWMSHLESEAKPLILTQITQQYPTFSTVEVDQHQTLARWAFKTAVVLNAASNYRQIVPSSHYRRFYESRVLPQNVWVDAGVLPSGSGLSWDQSQFLMCFAESGDEARVRESQAASYNIVLAIGTLVLRVFHSPLLDYELEGESLEGDMARIHPDCAIDSAALREGPDSLYSFAHDAVLRKRAPRAV